MKRIWYALLALVLLALVAAPWAIRYFSLHQGGRVVRTIARPDLSQVEVASPVRTQYADEAAQAPAGTVLVDGIHDNLYQPADLSLLQERLAARGQQLETIAAEEDLAGMLRYAKALVVLSPLADWGTGEVELVERFVARGGRLLLVSDATHYSALHDDWGYLIGLDHDAPHLNSLAARFGLHFQPDYLYNLADNANNYRNVKLTQFAADPLTAGIDELVFFGARSIESKAPGLVVSSPGTVSNADDRVAHPAAAVLAADGQVLGLGDSTFLSEPYNGIAGNDLFVSHIADFLSRAERRYALDDFPYFLQEGADLVYLADPLLDSDLLPATGGLQSLFAEAGKELVVKEAAGKEESALYLGLYGEAAEVEEYLADAGVTLIVPAEDDAGIEPGLDFTATLTATEELTSRIEIDSVGSMVMEGTALVLHTSAGERQIVIVLAETVTGLQAAVERLIEGDLEGCVLREGGADLALCPTGELEEGEGTGGWPKPEQEGEEGEGHDWGGVGARPTWQGPSRPCQARHGGMDRDGATTRPVSVARPGGPEGAVRAERPRPPGRYWVES